MSEATARPLLDTLGRRNRRLADRECLDCGQFFRPKGANSKYCSRSCMWKNNGKHQGAKPTTPLSTYLRRFWSRVNKDQECWLWTGPKDWHGYGQFKANGRRYQAHCFAYLLAHGEIPAGLELDHLCRMPPCVKVDHLEAVTHAENIRRGYLWKRAKKHNLPN